MILGLSSWSCPPIQKWIVENQAKFKRRGEEVKREACNLGEADVEDPLHDEGPHPPEDTDRDEVLIGYLPHVPSPPATSHQVKRVREESMPRESVAGLGDGRQA